MAIGVSGNLIGISLAIVASISGALGNLLFRLSWKADKYRKLIRFAGLCTGASGVKDLGPFILSTYLRSTCSSASS